VIFPNPIMLIIILFAGLETLKRWRLRRTDSPAQRAYYRVRPRDRALVAVGYLALIALLVVGMSATHLHATFG
jgi:hypothetical protein